MRRNNRTSTISDHAEFNVGTTLNLYSATKTSAAHNLSGPATADNNVQLISSCFLDFRIKDEYVPNGGLSIQPDKVGNTGSVDENNSIGHIIYHYNV
jgi:hypothetical protein